MVAEMPVSGWAQITPTDLPREIVVNSFLDATDATPGDGNALDTTGAGDMWAAGFLYGRVNGYPLEKCGQLGSACGYEVCQVVGANIPDEGWARIKLLL